IGLKFNNLAGGNFSGQKLINVDFSNAILTDADFTDAEISGTNFSRRPRFCGLFSCHYGNGISAAQLYATASYQAGDLSGINFDYNFLSGSNFAGQNLTNASFVWADLSAADARGALGFIPSTGYTANLILPNGHIDGLSKLVSPLPVVRDYDG